MGSHASSTPESIVIVGGGASAVYVTHALRERAAALGVPAPRITVVGREAEVGRGLAYGRADDHHRLNSPAGKMSLSATDDAAFLRYLDRVGWRDVDGSAAGAGTYVPRRVFGDYVAEAFAELSATPESGVSFVHGDVVDVVEVVDVSDSGEAEATAAPVSVTLADGSVLTADRVVLALGNPSPGPVPANADRIVDDPWAPGALDGVTGRDRVLLVGTGLTMIDVATSLARQEPGVHLTATSRHLLLPAVHLAGPATPGPGLGDEVATLGGMASLFAAQLREAKAAGAPWQTVIDGMRPQMQDLWLRLSIADRERFLAHGARRWDVHRHRMAPTVWAELSGLIEDGTLTLRAVDADERFDVAVNCTGPASVASSGWNPLVDALLATGALTADPTGIGVAATRTGALVGSDGTASDRLYTIGAALKGALWETVAIGEVRLMAYRMADAMLASATASVDDAAEVVA
ncbi:FAD/NAD(P)-binding protein [Frondihabitans australicus]|uniref:Putative NAD(P)/FAD-binding protein YdhS n=1 Tax=Frondihabitans australicus TaxID=386892 RepID=A0A495IMI1_9MICO|nr:FAD/NAD(P)-binding protein [Frondihabitans australicus]RKR76648.1 putative NAD(P)/FAD-binding protein YdhS [Frondihabitans australicus]